MLGFISFGVCFFLKRKHGTRKGNKKEELSSTNNPISKLSRESKLFRESKVWAKEFPQKNANNIENQQLIQVKISKFSSFLGFIDCFFL